MADISVEYESKADADARRSATWYPFVKWGATLIVILGFTQRWHRDPEMVFGMTFVGIIALIFWAKDFDFKRKRVKSWF